MAFALSSSLKAFASPQSWPSLQTNRFVTGNLRPYSLLLPRHSLSTSLLAFSRRRSRNSDVSPSSDSKKKKKKNSSKEDEDEDAFEALFNMLEEDLKNDKSFGSDEDDEDISEEDFEQLQRELEAVLGIGEDDDDVVDVELQSSDATDTEHDNDDVDVDDEEEEEVMPVKLKSWQMRRLARVLKTGRRKTSIKSLAAELCLDRAVVLELLRDPPPNLVMLSAGLRDEPEPAPLLPESKPIDITPVEVTTVEDVKSGGDKKLPVHVMRESWSAHKRIKKVHLETLERVYRRTKRPTNLMVSNIVQVTNLPRKKVVKWFEDKRNEDEVPETRLPYQSFTNRKNEGDQLTRDRLKSMATLQRSSKVFRRQGSSGEIWDESFLLGDDKTDYRELRPCQSGSNIRNMDCSSSSSIAAPSSCPRSLSTPAMKQTSCKGSAIENRSSLPIPKSRSGSRNLLLGILSGHK